jgi:hypothetical protein
MKTEELTQQRLEQKQTAGKLLSPEERGVCKQLAAGEAPWSQRAQALLALDEGATQAQAGSQAGLSLGQVRYWLGRYRKDGLSIVPEAELSQTQPDPAPEIEESPGAVGKEAADELTADAAAAEKPKQKKKKKKKRKAKKTKGERGRSDKKSKKKAKKSKKKGKK